MRQHAFTAVALAAAVSLSAPATAANIDLFTANASTTTLTLTAVPPPGNQPLNQPCLICGTNQPQQPAGFGFNNYFQNGNETSFVEFSSATVGARLQQDEIGTGYSRAFLLAFLAGINSNSFSLGIDVNTGTGQGPEVLERFAVLNLTQHTILSQYIGPTALPTLNNGSGFPDYVLSGFDINRGDILPGDSVIFFARWSNASDGAESFFLVPGPTAAVPGPIAGAGLPGALLASCFGLWALVRRRQRA